MMDLMIDIDDVLFPLAVGLHRKAHELGLHDGTKEALEVWHGHEQYGCHVDEWHAVFDALHDEDYYLLADPIPGSTEALRRIWWEGHKIHLVTARGFMAQGEAIRNWTAQWIAEHAIPHDTLTFSKEKPQAMLDLGVHFDYALDDGIHNYQALIAAGVQARLLNVPHNAAEQVRADHRFDSVGDFADFILREAP